MPQISATDPHRFSINGQTWFPAGYYGSAFSVIDGAFGGGYGNFQAFNHEWLDDLAGNRLNYARLWAGYDSLGIDGPVMHPYAMASGSQVNLDQWNDDYFSLLADTVSYAKGKGVALQLILLHCGTVDYDGGAHRPENYFYGSRNVNGVSFTTSAEWFATSGPIWERHKRFVNKLLDTVGSQPNLTYEICNEKFVSGGPADASFDQTRNDPFIRAMYDVIRARGDQHVVVGVDIPEHRSLPGFFVPNYSGNVNVLNTSADIGGMHSNLVGWYGANVPVITDNDCCGGEPSADVGRQKVWAALTAGAHADYFNNEIWAYSVLRNANTQNGMRWIGYARKFVEERCIQLAGMHPADGAAKNGWTLARDGLEYVVYLGNGGTTSIAAIDGKGYEAVWFNPRDGSTQPAAGPNFTAPDGNDWVLHVRVTADGGGTGATGGAATGGGGGEGAVAAESSCVPDTIYSVGNQALDASGVSSANGTRVQLWETFGNVNQHFRFAGDGSIRGMDDKCLDVSGINTADGTFVQLWDCWGGPNERWSYEADGSIVGLAGKCLDLEGGKTANGTGTILNTCNGAASQKFRVCTSAGKFL